MIEDSKTLLFYLVGLAGLIAISILFTGRIEPPPVEPLPITTAFPTEMATSVRLTEVAQEGCSAISEQIIFYVPDLTTLEDNRLLISGTVYASDFVTPLSGALIEVWPNTYDSPENPQYPPYLFRGQMHADAAGHYEFTTVKPGHHSQVYLYYQVRYQDDCQVGLKLFFVDDPAQGAAAFPRMKQVPQAPAPTSSLMLMKVGLAQVKPAGPLLRGPVDLVLPVPPPISSKTNLIPPGVTGKPLTISGVVYASDRKTPLPGARVEVWQANPKGFYEGYEYPPASFNLSGQMYTDAAGRYEFTTPKPSPFKVGQKYLPARIHFKVSYQDHQPAFTRLFFADDPYLTNFLPSPKLTIRLSEQVGPAGPAWQGNFDIHLPVPPPVP